VEKQWSLYTRYLVLVIVLLLLLGLLYYARALISPLVIAALIAYILEPAVSFLVNKARMRRKIAAPIVYAFFLVLLASIPAILTPIIFTQMDEIRAELGKIEHSLEELLIQVNLLGIPFFPDVQPGEIQDVFATLFNPQRVFGVLRAATENLAWILIIFVVTFYFLLDSERLYAWFISITPRPYQDDVSRLMQEIKLIWQSYLRGQLLLMVTVGVLTWIMGLIVGLPGALFIGLLAGALDVIPSLGPMVAMIIAGIVAYIEGPTYLPISRFWFVLLVVGLFMAIQVFENVWLRPRILSTRLRLHPALVFVAIIGALALAGVVAALVVVPIISSGALLGRYIFRKILGEDPWPVEASPIEETQRKRSETILTEAVERVETTEPGETLP
jgi:predicted PurR-regulated permease PerM